MTNVNFFLSVAIGLIAGYRLAQLIIVGVNWHRARQAAKNSKVLKKYDGPAACDDDKHLWEPGLLETPILPHGQYDICINCGIISGIMTHMLADEALREVQIGVEKINAKLKAEAKQQRELGAIAEQYIHQYLIKNFAEDLNDHARAQKLKELVLYVIEIKETAALKLENAEDDRKYGLSWPSKEGNA